MAVQSEWLEKDYYKVLGVPQSASERDITRAYRKLAKQYHPDAHPGSEERFKEIAAAYDVLGDGAKRKEYDNVRRLGRFSAAGRSGQATRNGPRTFNFRLDDLGDIGDLFGDLVNRRRAGSTTPRGSGPQRGVDLETELHLSFDDAIKGVTTAVNVVSEVPCHTCMGSGAAPGTTPQVCPACHGRGQLEDNQGPFSLARTCPTCQGSGTIIETPCPTCHGTGTERRNRSVKARIPAGVEEGSRIRLKGKGGAGRNNGPPGDLYVVVHVAPHKLFGRRGRDLTLTVPVTFPEATLGADISVPTLDGPVTLRIPPGTAPNRTFRVAGRGVRGADQGRPGDLLVTVDLVVPKRLSKDERQAIEALAHASHSDPRDRLRL